MTISPPMIPDMAARTTATMQVCTATEPRKRPPMIAMESNRDLAMPERSSTLAMKTKNGTAISSYLCSTSPTLAETIKKPARSPK